MKTRAFFPSLIAAALLGAAQSSHAMLLVGWYNFENESSSAETPDFAATGFSGTITKAGNSSSTGGDDGGGQGIFYGDSTIPSGPGNDGFLRQGTSATGTRVSMTNDSGAPVSLATFLFDAAATGSNRVITVSYRIGTGDFSADIGSFTNLPVIGVLNSLDFADLSVSLAGIPTLGDGETIQFRFLTSPSVRLDNIAITAIPEPASMLALGGIIGAGLLLRSRPRRIAKQTLPQPA
jgi:hypothetical protein